MHDGELVMATPVTHCESPRSQSHAGGCTRTPLPSALAHMDTATHVGRSGLGHEAVGDAHMLDAVDPHSAAWASGKIERGGT
jgi:hypothetical protein